jgi:hypothetical protein
MQTFNVQDPIEDTRTVAAGYNSLVPILSEAISMTTNRDKYLPNDYIGYILYNKEQSENDFDAIKLYNEDVLTDGHSSNYSSVNFMGRNEPVQIYKNGGERKYSIKLQLIASVSVDRAGPMSGDTRIMERDSMSVIDIDYIARTMLSWTYSEYKAQYSAPKRVWLTYGNVLDKLPCVVTDVRREIPKNSPWDKYGDGSYEFLPHIQSITVELIVCPESLYIVPGASDIAIRDTRMSGSANEKYGTPGIQYEFNVDESVYQPILAYLSNINPNNAIPELINILRGISDTSQLSTLAQYAYNNNTNAFNYEFNRVINNSRGLQFANSNFGRDTSIFEKNVETDNEIINSIKNSLPTTATLIRL